MTLFGYLCPAFPHEIKVSTAISLEDMLMIERIVSALVWRLRRLPRSPTAFEFRIWNIEMKPPRSAAPAIMPGRILLIPLRIDGFFPGQARLPARIKTECLHANRRHVICLEA
jgi:hypothetical protein